MNRPWTEEERLALQKLLDEFDWTGVVFSGEKLFELKTTHGLPLDFVLARVMNELGMRVSWVDFIEAARKNGWWDFQTYDVMCHALVDAGIPRDTIEEIKKRFQLYVLKHPHQMMKENT